MPKVKTNDIEIYYEIHGQGEPLLLIEPLGYDLWIWHKMLPGLAEHFQVIAFDNRGVGQSDRPKGPYTADMLADDAAGLMEALGLESAHVLGYSMGGYVAQALVLKRPELIRKLILAATTFAGPNEIPVTPEALAVMTDMSLDLIERFRRGIAVSTAPGFAESNPEFVEDWISYSLNARGDLESYQAQLAVGLALKNHETGFQPMLKWVKAPALLLFGAHDQVVPPKNGELLAQEIPDSAVHILANAGHLFPFDAPEDAVEAIVSFLKA